MRYRLPWPIVIAGSAGVLAVLVAWGEVHNWGLFLRFLYQVPYGANDPLYDKGIGFYLFSLPAYIAIKNWMLLTLFLSAFFAGAVYWVHGDIQYDAHRRSISATAIAHGSVLLGFFFAVKAWSYGLDRYLLLYGDNGVVIGAGYTDIHVELPVLWLLIGLSIVAAFAAWANVRVRTYRLPVAAAPVEQRQARLGQQTTASPSIVAGVRIALAGAASASWMRGNRSVQSVCPRRENSRVLPPSRRAVRR